MSNGRNPGRNKRDNGRDPGGFVALPWSVLDSAAYLSLTVHAKALLLEVARQYHRDDNGRMLLSRAYLAPRGWNSSDMIMKGKRELLAAGLIFETAKGMRPNKASWYAVTWRMLDRNPAYDFGAEQAFVRGAYRLKGTAKPLLKNASLRPPHGTEKAPIAPPHGTETPAAVPPHGHPLDLPVSCARLGGSPTEPDPAAREEKAGAHPERPARLEQAAKPATPPTCQHPNCSTLVLVGRVYCTKHKHQAEAAANAQRVRRTRTQSVVDTTGQGKP